MKFLLLALLVACRSVEPDPATTSGAIALANLDHLIAQASDPIDLWLTRARFLGDSDALARAYRAASHATTAGELVRRARTRSAVHEFAAALVDLDRAARAGADPAAIARERATIWIATGRGDAALALVDPAPSFASASARASAYAAVGRFADADASYRAALTALAASHTTSPWPYAWLYFARGVLWAELADDPVRGAAMYARAIDHVPDFVVAHVHLAELEAARGQLALAIARLHHVVAFSRDPEPLGLLGTLHLATDQAARGHAEIAAARARYADLLAHFPLAYADHAAELALGPDGDPARARALAQLNLANRPTPRAIDLALRALSAANPRSATAAADRTAAGWR